MKILNFNRLTNLWPNMKLKAKLLVSYFFLIVIPFGFFTLFSNLQVSSAVETLVKYSAKQSFDQTGEFVTYKIKKIIDVMNVIIMDKDLNATLSQNPDSVNINQQLKIQYDLNNYLLHYKNNDEIFDIKLYVDNRFLFSGEDSDFLSLQDEENSGWYKDQVSDRRKVYWRSPQKIAQLPSMSEGRDEDQNTVISAISSILDSNNYSRTLGLVRIDIQQSNLNAIIRKSSATKNNITYLINSKNEIISSSNMNIPDSWKLNTKLLTDLMHNNSYFDIYSIGNYKFLLACESIPNSDWLMVSVTPYAEISAVGKNIVKGTLLLFLLIGTAAYGVSFLISSSITKRIWLLIKNMRNVQTGNFNSTTVSNSQDEIGELVTNFNEMSAKLSFLIQEQFRIGQEAKASELKALQAQINPHFLYNTLDLINWTAINNNVPEISSIVRSLSKFYKLSLSKGLSIIPIADEIEHVKMYMDLQNKRFNNAFVFELEADPAVYSFCTAKIILQPIVENAIIHGILQKVEKKGSIKLSVALKNGTVIFTITDDGIGISDDKIGQILLTPSSEELHGYGIRNINEKIKLLYGDGYGLTYKSNVSIGTTVTIKIPAVKLENTKLT
jgi:two-component system, sensor histidine kinase YesM